MKDGEYLAQHLSKIGTTPFLFVGSGVSRRYLATETWEDLLRRFASSTGKPYEYFRSTGNNELPRVAEALSHAFHDVWWQSEAFRDSRDAFGASATTRSSALKIELSRHLRSLPLAPTDPQLREELALLRSAVVDGIITTNWDLLLESCFPDYKVFVGQDELLFASPQSIAELYKIHGSCTRPDSLVLTAEDYAAFNSRNAYLAAKLLAIFVEHPVIFLGYSLSDSNIIGILKAIAACLRNDNIDKLRDRLIMIEWNPTLETEQVATTAIVSEGWSLPITQIQTSWFGPTFQVLAGNERRIPARILRFLKEHIYDLVKVNDPLKQIYVEDINTSEEMARAEVVLGVGAVGRLGDVGYQAIERLDLIRDVVLGTNKYDPGQIVDKTLPRVCKSGARFIPMFMYLRGAGKLNDDGTVIDDLSDRVASGTHIERGMYESSSHRNHRDAVRKANLGIAEMEEEQGRWYVLDHAALLQDSEIDLHELALFLASHIELLDGEPYGWYRQQYVKLACLYDRLKFRKAKTKKAGKAS